MYTLWKSHLVMQWGTRPPSLMHLYWSMQFVFIEYYLYCTHCKVCTVAHCSLLKELWACTWGSHLVMGHTSPIFSAFILHRRNCGHIWVHLYWFRSMQYAFCTPCKVCTLCMAQFHTVHCTRNCECTQQNHSLLWGLSVDPYCSLHKTLYSEIEWNQHYQVPTHLKSWASKIS